MDIAIEARDLVKRYGALEAVRGVSFSVRKGETVGLLGPNGAGKTTTIRMIVSLAEATSGALTVLGHELPRGAREAKRGLGVAPQEETLDADMNARENLIVHARFFDVLGKDAHRKADELLAFMGLTDKALARVSELSGGMKRRLVVARALVNDPELLVLDEPTTGLDPHSRQLVWDKIRALAQEGKTILLTTHYMEEAERLSDRILIMDEGRIIAEGPPADLVRDRVGREVLEVEIAPEDEPLLDVRPFARAGGALRFAAEDAEALLVRLRERGVRPKRALVRRSTLEDVFIRLTGKSISNA